MIFSDVLSDGDIYAGVVARCASSGSYMKRWFNNVNSQTITITDGTSLGYCKINFGFDITNRFIIVTAAHPDTPLDVSISSPPLSGNEVTLFVWHDAIGAPVEGGEIHLIVY